MANQFDEVMQGWAERDADAAFQYLLSLSKSRVTNTQTLMDRFFNKLRFTNAAAGIRLLPARLELGNGTEPLPMIFNGLALTDPERALKEAESLQGPYAKYSAMYMTAWSNSRVNPASALKSAIQMPTSENSLAVIRDSAENLARVASDPYAIVEQECDSYQRAAAVQGITDGLYSSKGVTGIVGAVEKGLQSNDHAWLESAGSVILARPASADCKLLPKSIIDALISYAENNWTRERVASFTG